MNRGLTTESAQSYACENGLILTGFTVELEHSIVLCERGHEYAYSKKRREQAEKPAKERREWPV